MKFLTRGNHLAAGEAMMRVCLLLGLLMIFFGWVSNILIFIEKMGFNYTAVVEYYRGNDEQFKTPVSYLGLLEATHFHLFGVVVILILLNHLAIFSRVVSGLKYSLIFISFFSAILNILSGWLIVYVAAAFALLKIAAFSVFQISTGCLLVLVTISLTRERPRQRT